MGYQIVTAGTVELLVEKVNILLDQGWITQGGVSYSSKERLYMQSMITGFNSDPPEETESSADDIQAVIDDAIEGFKIDDSIPPERWDYDYMKITDIEETSISVRLALIKLNILTVGDLLKAVKTKEFKEKASDKLKEAVKKMIEQYGWKD